MAPLCLWSRWREHGGDHNAYVALDITLVDANYEEAAKAAAIAYGPRESVQHEVLFFDENGETYRLSQTERTRAVWNAVFADPNSNIYMHYKAPILHLRADSMRWYDLVMAGGRLTEDVQKLYGACSLFLHNGGP